MKRAQLWRTGLVVAAVGAASAGAWAAGQQARPVLHVVRGKEAPAHLIAGGQGSARLLVHAGTGASAASLTHLTLAPGAAVPPHVHEGSAELLYIEQGEVEMTVEGKVWRAGAGDAVYVPAGARHSARVLGRFQPLRAVQVYAGPGPEQRFAGGERHPGE